MNATSLYLWRTELYNVWKASADSVTLEFEMWLIDRLVRETEDHNPKIASLMLEVQEYRKLYLEYKDRYEFLKQRTDIIQDNYTLVSNKGLADLNAACRKHGFSIEIQILQDGTPDIATV